MLEKLWQYISVDFTMKLPVSRGYNFILVVCKIFKNVIFYNNNRKNNGGRISKVVWK